MKRAATISLAMTLLTLNVTLSSAPVLAEEVLGNPVQNAMVTTVSTGTVPGTTANLISGTVTTNGEVTDVSGRVLGTIVPGALATAVAVPVAGARPVVIGTTTNVLGMNIDMRMAEMRRVLADYSLTGRLTPPQVSELSESLDKVSTTLVNDRVTGRTLTFAEAADMAHDLDDVAKRFGTFLGYNPWPAMLLMESGNPKLTILLRNDVAIALPGSQGAPKNVLRKVEPR